MMMRPFPPGLPAPRSILATLLLLGGLSACNGGRDATDANPAPRADAPTASVASRVAEPELAACLLDSPLLQVGAGLDAPGRLEVDRPAAGSAAAPCGQARGYRMGSGLADVTGIIVNTGGAGWENPFQIYSGLHTRQYARAFAIESPCNGQRLLFMSADIGMIWTSLRRGVLDAIAADEELSAVYGPENIMLSATHTHSGAAGFSHDDGGNLFHYGFDEDTYALIVDGIVRAIRRAHANLEAHPEEGTIRLATGELLNTNINRSKPAFVQNPEAERAAFTNERGEIIDNNKRVVQLTFERADGSRIGLIHWFGVHPTVVGPTTPLVSGDNKGYAALLFERLMRTDYAAAEGEDTFVAAFAQADEGDASPNIAIEEFPFPDPRRGGGADDYESNRISGTKHLVSALQLFGEGRPLQGPVDTRLMRVRMPGIEITDPVVLDSLAHPEALDAQPKRTCDGALGVSFGAGAEDGRGPTEEGARCDSSPDLLAAAQRDVAVLLDPSIAPFPESWPAEFIPPHVASAVAMCNFDELGFLGDYDCQAEKPVLLPSSTETLPFQLIRIGNLAVLGLPWEVTTVAARRLRSLLYPVLAPVGVDTLVIAGLVNDFAHYLTTREEYSAQQYEGASTLYGPWTHAAVAQQSLVLARAMRDGEPAPEGEAPVRKTPRLIRPPYIPSDLPGNGGDFGATVSDAPATAAPGDVVEATFVAGHPRNDPRIGGSYAYVERQRADGDWEVVYQDRDAELWFYWEPAVPPPLAFDPPFTGPSNARLLWRVPRNQAPGTYRLRHEGVAQITPLMGPQPYTGISGPVEVDGPRSACP